MFAYYPPEWESLQSRIVGRWCPSFSGATGLQLPDTTGRNHGVLTNMDRNTSWISSEQKTSLLTTGGGYIRASRPRGFLLSDFTICFWYYPLSFTGTYTALIEGDQRDFSLFTNGSNITFIATITRGDVTSATINFQLNSWNFFCVTKTGSGNLTFFNNGIQRSTHAIPFVNEYAFSTFFYLGANITTGGTNSNAFYDDIMIFNTASTHNEVQFIYEQGRGGGLLLQPPRRRSYFAAGGFKAYWARRRSQLIGGGL
jgi:hypothetical protein